MAYSRRVDFPLTEYLLKLITLPEAPIWSLGPNEFPNLRGAGPSLIGVGSGFLAIYFQTRQEFQNLPTDLKGWRAGGRKEITSLPSARYSSKAQDFLLKVFQKKIMVHRKPILGKI